ncbi:MAG TPA: hypothetical protein PK648_12100 [Verrucomicrobiales bacterium]|nr:hypothetical protein [Verrucomicrobiales bacterium]
MKLSFTSLTGAFLLLALACPASAQDESKEDLVKRLKVSPEPLRAGDSRAVG